MILATEIDSKSVYGLIQNSKINHSFSIDFLNLVYQQEIDWWAVFKGKEVVCVWPLISREGFANLPPFVYWFGPIWLRDERGSKDFMFCQSVYATFFESFSLRYKRIVFELSPTELDVRFFDWYSNSKDGKSTKIIPRYTARIHLAGHNSNESIRNGYSELRRRELRKFHIIKNGYREKNIVESSALINLYSQTLKIPSEDLEPLTQIVLSNLSQLTDSQLISFTCLYGIDDELDGLICTFDTKNARNLVLNLVSARVRNSGMMTYLIDSSLDSAFLKKLTFFDFNGANSPLRAQDKHSYGSESVLYFRVIVDWSV